MELPKKCLRSTRCVAPAAVAAGLLCVCAAPPSLRGCGSVGCCCFCTRSLEEARCLEEELRSTCTAPTPIAVLSSLSSLSSVSSLEGLL